MVYINNGSGVWARVSRWNLQALKRRRISIALTARIGREVKLGDSCAILRRARVEDRAVIGSGAVVFQRARVFRGEHIGSGREAAAWPVREGDYVVEYDDGTRRSMGGPLAQIAGSPWRRVIFPQ